MEGGALARRRTNKEIFRRALTKLNTRKIEKDNEEEKRVKFEEENPDRSISVSLAKW